MEFRKFNFVDKQDYYGHLFMYILLPYSFLRLISKSSYVDYNDYLMIFTFIFTIISFSVIYFIYLQPKLISHIEFRGNEARFFKIFPNRWGPLDKYRFIADGPDVKKVIVYENNCKKLGKIGLKSADPDEKREFLKIIEPYLRVRGVDADFSLSEVKD